MTILNDPAAIRKLDSLHSIVTTENYHLQFAEGLGLANSFVIPQELIKDYHEVLILGTGGGSSIAGALLTSLFFDQLKAPVIINQGYNLPAFADGNTLVVALSHSGNTEEILSNLGQARREGCPAIAITAGGALGEICTHEGIPFLVVPRDIGHPRRDLGYIVPPLVTALAKLGLVPDISQEIKEAISLMEELSQEYGAHVPVEKNLAKRWRKSYRAIFPWCMAPRTTWPPQPGAGKTSLARIAS